MKPIPSFLVASLARNDLTRISSELYSLQRQTASGHLANDLKGYGSESGRIVSGRAAVAQSNARIDVAKRLITRLEIQDTALSKATSAAQQLRQDIMTALATDNGEFLATQLDIAYQGATDALNTEYDGAPLFAGDRRDAGPTVTALSLDKLSSKVNSGALFEESVRTPSLDVGLGAPVTVGEKASSFATKLYGAFHTIHLFVSANDPGSPLSADHRTQLIGMVNDLDAALGDMLGAQGRNGDTLARVERGVERLTAQSDLLSKHLGETADADLAEVAMKLSAAQTQYQAAAKVFAQIKDMSLINFLD